MATLVMLAGTDIRKIVRDFHMMGLVNKTILVVPVDSNLRKMVWSSHLTGLVHQVYMRNTLYGGQFD